MRRVLQKVDADEKLLVKHDLSPAPYQAPTPHPLPSYEIITHEEVEPEITSRGQPLPTPEAVAPAMPIKVPEKELENVIEEEENTSSNIDAEVVEKHQDDDDDSTLSEEEEAAARIQQRFSEPLVRCNAFKLKLGTHNHIACESLRANSVHGEIEAACYVKQFTLWLLNSAGLERINQTSSIGPRTRSAQTSRYNITNNGSHCSRTSYLSRTPC